MVVCEEPAMSETATPPEKGQGPEPPDDVSGLVEVADRSVRGHGLARGFVLGFVLCAAMAIFILQNTGTTEVDWLWLDFEARLWALLLVAFLTGLIAGPLLIAGWRRAARERTRRQRLVDRFKQSRKAKSSAPVQGGT
jgi:uncharacterized integral membrane protein